MKKPDTFFRVMLRAEWEIWTVYRDLDDAILAAEGLITSEMAIESEVFAVSGPNEMTSVCHVKREADGSVLTRRTTQ